ncbi:MAG: hypothetical protein JXR11_00815 [Balneola sp.]
MKYLLLLIITLIIILMTTAVIVAQPGLPGDPAQAPIDGGLGLLAAAGGAYAYKKLRGKNKEDDLG